MEMALFEQSAQIREKEAGDAAIRLPIVFPYIKEEKT